MENLGFDWLDGDFAFNNGALEFSASDSPRVGPAAEGVSPLAGQADPLAEQADQLSGVYKHHRCRGKHCKQGPHCWTDGRGNHHRLLPRHLEEIVSHIKGSMKEGEKEEEIDVHIEMPPKSYKMYWMIAASGRPRAPSTVVSARSRFQPTTGIPMRPRQPLTEISGQRHTEQQGEFGTGGGKGKRACR